MGRGARLQGRVGHCKNSGFCSEKNGECAPGQRPQEEPACIRCLLTTAALVTFQVLVKMGALSERRWAPTGDPRSRAWKLGKAPSGLICLFQARGSQLTRAQRSSLTRAQSCPYIISSPRLMISYNYQNFQMDAILLTAKRQPRVPHSQSSVWP